MTLPSRDRAKRFRIGTLESLSGVTRDAIHHYLSLGLLPAPEKTATTVAWYDRRHVEALKRIKALRALGVPLGRIARVLGELAPEAPLEEVVRVGRMLSPRERSPLPVTWDHLDAPTRELARRVGLGDSSELDGAMRAALAELLALDPASRSVATARAASCVALLRTMRREMGAALFGSVAADERIEDPLGRNERARRAMRAVVSAGWDQVERETWEETLRLVFDESRRVSPAAFLPTSTAAVEGATLRLAVLEGREELGAWRERLRLILGTQSAKRLGEFARTALAAEVRDPWVELALAVAHVDGRRYADARDNIARALGARPRWSLAHAFSLAIELLYHADRGTPLDAASVPARLAALRFDDPQELPERARALLVVAQTAAALPEATGAGATARDRCDELLALLDAIPSGDHARATGELGRIEANALLLRARLAAQDGEVDAARDWYARAADLSGPPGRIARAALRATGDPNEPPEPPGT